MYTPPLRLNPIMYPTASRISSRTPAAEARVEIPEYSHISQRKIIDLVECSRHTFPTRARWAVNLGEYAFSSPD